MDLVEHGLSTGWIRNRSTAGGAFVVAHLEWFPLAWFPAQHGDHARKEIWQREGDFT